MWEKSSTYFGGGVIDVWKGEQRRWLYVILSIIYYFYVCRWFHCTGTHSYMHYELWDEIIKKICIDNKNLNEVSDCLRIKTMLSKTFHLYVVIDSMCCWSHILVMLVTLQVKQQDKQTNQIHQLGVVNAVQIRKIICFIYQVTGGDLSSH